jgi:hypothetical protein
MKERDDLKDLDINGIMALPYDNKEIDRGLKGIGCDIGLIWLRIVCSKHGNEVSSV